MKAIILYESLTGTTKLAGEAIAAVLRGQQWEASACPVTDIDMQGLADADLVIVGSWTDGIFLFGQKPARSARLRAMPSIESKVAAVYCTYAIDPGKTLEKLSGIVAGKGADVLGGYAIHRKDVQAGAVEFVARALSQLETASPTSSLESAPEGYRSGVAQL